MTRHLAFVYGTLKRNEPNHHWLEDTENGEARFVGVGTTEETYPLVVASRYNIPYILAAEGTGKHVQGEVYDVDDKMLSNLDILEDHPDYYERKLKNIKLENSGEVVECWVYLLFKYKPHLLELPFLTSYLPGDQSKPYIPRYLREEPGPEYWTDVKVTDFKSG